MEISANRTPFAPKNTAPIGTVHMKRKEEGKDMGDVVLEALAVQRKQNVGSPTTHSSGVFAENSLESIGSIGGASTNHPFGGGGVAASGSTVPFSINLPAPLAGSEDNSVNTGEDDESIGSFNMFEGLGRARKQSVWVLNRKPDITSDQIAR